MRSRSSLTRRVCSATVPALGSDCLGACLVLHLCSVLLLSLSCSHLEEKTTTTALDIRHDCPRLCTFCCCFVRVHLQLPLVCFSSDVRAHLSATISLAISIVHQRLMIWPLLFERFHDPRSTQRVLCTSQHGLRTGLRESCPLQHKPATDHVRKDIFGGTVHEKGCRLSSPLLAFSLRTHHALHDLCERGLFSRSAKPDTAAGIVAVDPRFSLQSVRKSRTTLRQTQEVATRHEMEE